MVLKQLKTGNYFDNIISNEDVNNPAPSRNVLKATVENNVLPIETLIIEDSPVGRKAAMMSGANHYFVNSNEVDYKSLEPS